MVLICPQPMVWNEVHKKLLRYAKLHVCTPPAPPIPSILAGWAYSNDIEKMERWRSTIVWAYANGCRSIVDNIAEHDFYSDDEPSSYAIGPLGGPCYRPWDHDSKTRPSDADLDRHLGVLASAWSAIVGGDLGRVTAPLAFAGKKARRLLVRADVGVKPPWGDWRRRSSVEAERRTFTTFRAAINKAIKPHEVDHVDFVF